MNNYLPSFYNVSDVVINIQNAIGIEEEALKEGTQDLFKQLFIDTATWGLTNWEKYLNISSELNKPYEFRRTVIKSKLRGTGTTTVAMIKNVAESFSNGAVDVIEDNGNYRFTIKFTGVLGIPPNLEDFKAAIEETKPAHLSVVYEFTYNTWGMVSGLKWSEAKLRTWDGLRCI